MRRGRANEDNCAVRDLNPRAILEFHAKTAGGGGFLGGIGKKRTLWNTD